ncbi:DUF317 domain-containing protein [Streptomyces fragilis]|uniref:DUF317 domain-containing protein n=1 Tax=Streptomyces fragilis TaxID=67301 RepID=A0ABV2YCC1_9ACTN|nr:DUF317 domain-containing protein [Streptomyces fragilis]
MNHWRTPEEHQRRLRQLALFLRDSARIDAAWHARLARAGGDGEPPSDRPYARAPLVRRRDAELWRAFNRIRFHALTLLDVARAQMRDLPDELVEPSWADKLDALDKSISYLNFLHQEWVDHRELLPAEITPGSEEFAAMIAERNAEGRLEIRVWAEKGHVLQDIHAAACPEPVAAGTLTVHTDWLETSPRHLAGQGDARYITRALRAAGWRASTDPDRPSVALTSTDRRHTVVLEPGPNDLKPWWHIHGATEHGSWHAEFTAHTPVEILSALTDSLDHPVSAHDNEDVWTVFTAAGWSYERDDLDTEIARHPYRTLRVSRWTASTTDHFHWTVEATFPDPGLGADIVWRASLDDTTPPHLLHALAQALTSDAPALREMFDVPHTHLVTQTSLSHRGTRAARELEHRLHAPLGRLHTGQAGQRPPVSRRPSPPPPSTPTATRTP